MIKITLNLQKRKLKLFFFVNFNFIHLQHLKSFKKSFNT